MKMVRRIVNEVEDIFDVKSHKICMCYYETDVNGVLYLRPLTAAFYEPINKGHGKGYLKFIYNKACKLLWERQTTRRNDYMKEKGLVDDEIFKTFAPPELKKEVYKIRDSDVSEIRNLILHMARNKLTEDEQDILKMRLTCLETIFFARDEMQFILNYALDMEPLEDLDISNHLYDVFFKKVEVPMATADLIEIATTLKKGRNSFYSYTDIINLKFKDGVLDVLQAQALAFVNKHGLLGVLNDVFYMNDKLLLGMLDMDAVRVITFMSTASITIDRNLSDNTKRMSEYIKLFFPNEPFMRYYEEFQMMDTRYWSRYSEPLYIILLAARVLIEQLERIRKNDPQSMSPHEFKGMTMFPEYSDDHKTWLYRFQFSSLFDAIRYYAIYGIHQNMNQFRCEGCHKIVSKKKEAGKYKREYCSDRCGNKVRGAKHRKGKITKSVSASSDETLP
jgi:hypothetical protein